MSKAIKAISLIVGLIIIGLIGRCVYMVVCISCTTSSLKSYDYAGSMDQFETDLKNFASSNSNVNFKIVPRGGGENDARDITIKNKTLSGNLRYELVLHKFNETTQLDIDCIYDETHKTGGCDTKDPGVEELFEKFKKDFLARFEKEQNVDLKPNLFNF